MTLSLGTRIVCGNARFTILACGNGYYTVQIDGSTTRWTLRCEDAIADIKSGVAKVLYDDDRVHLRERVTV